MNRIVFFAAVPRPQCQRPGLKRAVQYLMVLGLGLSLTGCLSFLKPAQSSTRYFVLTPVATSPGPTPQRSSIAVGVGRVRVPAYLLNSSLAIRRGEHEVEYASMAAWGERLDAGVQRVLAANLSTALPTDRVHLSSWLKEDVTAEVYIILEQFEVDAAGRGVLSVRWRIRAPGGAAILNAGRTRLDKPGPPPETDPEGAVTTLSSLLADFSQELAQVLRAEASTQPAAPGT